MGTKKFFTQCISIGDTVFHTYYDNLNNKRYEKIKDLSDYNIKIGLRNINNEKTNYKDIYGNYLNDISVKTVKEMKEYFTNKKTEYYNIIKPEYSVLSKLYKTNPLSEYPGDVSKDIILAGYDIEVLSDDGFPEPTKAEHEITSIAISIGNINQYKTFIIGYKDYNTNDNNEIYYKVNSEFELIQLFADIIVSNNIDVLFGYNSSKFDDLYVFNRAVKIGFDINNFSPFNKVHKWKEHIKIAGIELMDYLSLFKKFITDNLPSNSLDFVSNYVLKDKSLVKIDWHDKYKTFIELYENDYKLFIDYNAQDTKVLFEMEKKLRIFDLVYEACYLVGSNPSDTMGPVQTFDCLLYNVFNSGNVMSEPFKNNKKQEYPGAQVLELETGLYEWVLSGDLNSLYPMSIIQSNISPETLIKNRKDENLYYSYKPYCDNTKIPESIEKGEYKTNNYEDEIFNPSGCYFMKNKKGIFPKLMDKLYEKRKEYKNEMLKYQKAFFEGGEKDNELYEKSFKYKNKQMMYKIALLNSFYGAQANIYFRYFNIDLARSITLFGQLAIKWVTNRMKIYFKKKWDIDNPVIYGDTDSVTGDSTVRVKIKDKWTNMSFNNLFHYIMQNNLVLDIVTFKSENKMIVTPNIPIKTLAFDFETNKIIETDIKYLMKHKTDKKIYQIYFDNNKSVKVTEDHSLLDQWGYELTVQNIKEDTQMITL